MVIDGINKETGEYVKPYETPEHLDILKTINTQVKFVRNNIMSEDGKNLLSGKGGDALVEMLMILSGYYEVLGKWVSDERLHVNDMKSALEIKFANAYCDIKKVNSETNETARMKAKIICQELQNELDQNKHALDVIEKWSKAIGRYHDSTRSALGYEKSLASISR